MTGHHSDKPDRMQLLIMKKIDGELTTSEERELTDGLRKHSRYREELNRMNQLKKETQAMKKDYLPELAWQDYWNRLYNRLERSVSWILISVGTAILVGFGLWEALSSLLSDTETPLLIRYGLFALMMGAVLLLISVLREKLLLRKFDKYKGIQR